MIAFRNITGAITHKYMIEKWGTKQISCEYLWHTDTWKKFNENEIPNISNNKKHRSRNYFNPNNYNLESTSLKINSKQKSIT